MRINMLVFVSVLALIAGALSACSGDSPPTASTTMTTLVSTTSVQTSDTSTDGTWIAWAGKATAAGNSQIFCQRAGSSLAPMAITPDTGWIDGGNSLHDLVVSDGLVVWRGWNGSSYRIYAYDLAAAFPTVVDLSGAIPNADCFHTKGRIVVWSGGETPTVYIHRFDAGEQVGIPVTAVSTVPYPKTDGRFVVWMAGTWPVFNIYAYDLQAASPSPVMLTAGGWNAQPVVDNGVVAWYADVSGNYEIYYADAKLSTPVPVRVTTNAVTDEYPQIEDGVIVWSSSDGEVYYFDTNASSPTIVAVTNNVTIDGSWPSIPRISNGLIVWAGAVSGVTGDEIFYYDLKAAVPAVVRLTNNSFDDRKPHVANGRIVWVGDGGTWTYSLL